MAEVIEHMASYFAAAHHEVTAPSFAAGILAQQQAVVERALEQGRMIPKVVVDAVRAARIGDPIATAGAALPAYVNAGRWLVRCPDCAGCEFVDFTTPAFMCCSCWNASVSGAWRPVALPAEPLIAADPDAVAPVELGRGTIAVGAPAPATRAAIEMALLARPDALNRNWSVAETIADLVAENEAHGIGIAVDPVSEVVIG